MGIESAPYYWAVCDLCKDNLTEDEHSAWAQDDYVMDNVRDDGGYVGPDRVVLCNGCLNRYKPHLPDDEWDALDMESPEAVAALNAWLAEAKKEMESAP
jgi:hypothetical protein